MLFAEVMIRNNLPAIQTFEDAYECLIYPLRKLVAIREEKKQRVIFSLPDSANLPSKLLSYIETALCRSYEGEVLTLLVAGVKGKNALVEVHPVNQCGVKFWKRNVFCH